MRCSCFVIESQEWVRIFLIVLRSKFELSHDYWRVSGSERRLQLSLASSSFTLIFSRYPCLKTVCLTRKQFSPTVDLLHLAAQMLPQGWFTHGKLLLRGKHQQAKRSSHLPVQDSHKIFSEERRIVWRSAVPCCLRAGALLRLSWRIHQTCENDWTFIVHTFSPTGSLWDV